MVSPFTFKIEGLRANAEVLPTSVVLMDSNSFYHKFSLLGWEAAMALLFRNGDARHTDARHLGDGHLEQQV
mgnify:CR=1 FL=1